MVPRSIHFGQHQQSSGATKGDEPSTTTRAFSSTAISRRGVLSMDTFRRADRAQYPPLKTQEMPDTFEQMPV